MAFLTMEVGVLGGGAVLSALAALVSKCLCGFADLFEVFP